MSLKSFLGASVIAAVSLALPNTTLADRSDGPPSDAAATSVLSAGETFTCYLGDGGALYCWGQTQNGQLGDLTYGGVPQKTAVLVSGSGSLFSPTEVATGDSTVCVLLSDTKVKCWGANGNGETGNGKTRQTGSGNPNEVHHLGGVGSVNENNVLKDDDSTLDGVTQVSVGLQSTCAVATGGKVWCWGSNRYGQSGYGDTSGAWAYANPKARPVRDSSNNEVTGFASVAVGELFACGLKVDGTVWCWGNNANGQLGDGGTSDSYNPKRVTGISNATVIAAGGNHACAVTPGGLYCWGLGNNFRLGSARSGATLPVLVDIPNVVRVSAGFAHSCALDSSAQLWCWGRFVTDYFQGSYGDPSTSATYASYGVHGSATAASSPQKVTAFTAVKSFASGNNHVCAVEVDGPMKCWGVGTLGQLGNNQVSSFALPQTVSANTSQTFTIANPGTVRMASGTTSLSYETGSGVTPTFTSATESVCTVAGAVVTLKNVGTCTIEGVAGSHAIYESATASRSFTVGASAPTASTGAVASINANSASLAASVNARGAATTVTFELSTSEDMASPTTVTADSVEGVGATNVTKTVSDLKPLTTYYVRVKATNDQGTTDGDVISFKTLGSAPVVATGSATAQASKVTLNGTVDPKGLSTSVAFVYGLDPKLADGTSVAGTTQTGDGVKDVSVAISGLGERTTYYYRISATNDVGKSEGEIRSFTTSRPEGVSINNGEEFTSQQKVTVSVTGPSTAVKAVLSNDGGFATSETFDLTNNSADIPWTLQSSKQGTFTKIIYVKYVSRFGTQSTPYTDDIILDTTKPVLSAATAAKSPVGAAVEVAAVRTKAKAASSGVKLSVKGSDTISGIGKIEVRTSARKKATSVVVSKVRGKANGKPRAASQTVSLKTTAKRLQVRVVDRAGNASAWRTITVK